MAKKGGVFQALGNLWRWTIWGLAAVLVVALWLGWSNRANGPDSETVADATMTEKAADTAETAEETAVEEPATDADAEATDGAADVEEALDETGDAVGEAVETVADQVEEAAGVAADVASEAAESTVAEVQSALEGALGAAGQAASEAEDALSDLAGQAGAALEEAEGALEGATGEESVPATDLDEVAAIEGAVDEEQADLNILPPELSNITVPGDDATYSLVSVFQRDDGTIEVVSDRTLNGETEQTIRLVTCAPLAVGVIAEGDGPRNETPEMERIPLGTAAATIAALACGAMN